VKSETDQIRIGHDALRRLVTAIQTGYGVPLEQAEVVTDCLVESNLMGVDTHGVIRLKMYMDRVRAGGNNVRAEMKVLRNAGCTAMVDGDNGMGAVAGRLAMDMAMEKAEAFGVGIVVIRNCNHYGPAGYWARQPLPRDMIGISLCNTMASMPPTGGAAARQGNNPYAVGFPAGEEQPVVLDGATNMASWGKLYLLQQAGQPLPPDSFLDSEGNPTIDPEAVIAGGMLLPFAGHKGYGLAVTIELLTAMLADGTMDHHITHAYKHLTDPGATTFFMGAIRIDHFSEVDDFKRRMDEWIRFMHATPRAPGVDRIWLPGEKENVTREERLVAGIPLHVNQVEELRGLAREAKADFPL
jgi:LDH2 family malate/lactate/ureidoglycolate dehydrogenase